MRLLDLASTFARVGVLSFGGGSATVLLLRNELVSRHGWVTAEEFTRTWTLSKLSLGINLIAQVILYGRRLAGWRGIFVAVFAFILPSAAVTILLTVCLLALMGSRIMQDALRIVVPATAGLTMAIAVQMWNPKIEPARATSWGRFFLQGSIVLACALLVGLGHVPVPVVMIAAISAGWFWGR